MNKYAKIYITELSKIAKPTVEIIHYPDVSVDLKKRFQVPTPKGTANPIAMSALSAAGHGEAPKLPGMGLDRPKTWGESLAIGLSPMIRINGKLQMPDLNDPMLQQAQATGKRFDTGIIGKIQSLLTGRK